MSFGFFSRKERADLGRMRRRFGLKPKIHDYRASAMTWGRNCLHPSRLGESPFWHGTGWGKGLLPGDVVIFSETNYGNGVDAWRAFRVHEVAYNEKLETQWGALFSEIQPIELNPFEFSNTGSIPDIKARLLALRVGSDRMRRAQPM